MLPKKHLTDTDTLDSAARKWPFFDEDEINAAMRVMASGNVNYWTGPEGRLFETEFSNYTGSNHAIAVSSGTLSLDLAIRALQLQADDEVVVTPRSFMASVSTVVLLGCKPVFADVDLKSQNLDVESVAKVITPKTRAIIPVHHAGWPCDMPAMMDLARAHNLIVIEDCAQAHGAAIDGVHVGTFGHAGAYSFCHDKILTTIGEGGMLTTNDEDTFKRAQSFRDHGKNFDKLEQPAAAPTAFRYLHDSFGSNYRMTEVQSAVGRLQLGKLNKWRSIRTENAACWRQSLADTPGLKINVAPAHLTHAYYKLYLLVEPEALRTGWNRDRILNEICTRGVNAFTGSCPEIYNEVAFDAFRDSRPEKALKNAMHLGATSLMLLVDPTITQDRIAKDADQIHAVMCEATR